MIIELVANRLVSKYFGNNLYTWTGIIGIVLGGISLGNYLGGRIADKFEVKRIISPLLLVTSILIFLIFVLDLLVYYLMERGEFSMSAKVMILRSLVLMFVLFFLPSTALGTISPIMAKFALEHSNKIGSTVGSIYAVSSIGSILGTFLSGYLLIPLLGITTIIFIMAAVVGLLAILMGSYRLVGAGWIGVLIFLYLLSGGENLSRSIFPIDLKDVNILYTTDTKYSHLEVRDKLQENREQRVLRLDGLAHNIYDPSNPDDLLYEYEMIFASLTEHFVQNIMVTDKFSTLTIGGGACLFPGYLERAYPTSWNEVVEIDPEVVRVAGAYFNLSKGPRLQIITCDARNFVDYVKDKRNYNLIFLDAFNFFSIPYHLTTTEFLEKVSRILSVKGLFIANCIDIFSAGKFLNAYINTVASVFPYVYVYDDINTDQSNRSTFVVVGSFSNLEIETLYDAENVRIATRIPEEQLVELRSRNGRLVLSDKHAPVENLIGPVYLEFLK